MESCTVSAETPRKRQRTRALLLANAVALFRERGVAGTRLADVAERSQVAKATLFNHFPAKADLVEAWLRGELATAIREVGGFDDGGEVTLDFFPGAFVHVGRQHHEAAAADGLIGSPTGRPSR